MTDHSFDEQLTKYLTDVHSIEVQALEQMKRARGLAGDPQLAGFAYAFEALESGAYELLTRTARRAGDQRTVALTERILAEEQAAAGQVAGTWDAAVDATLATQPA